MRNVKIKISGPDITDLKLKTGRSIGPRIQRSSLDASINILFDQINPAIPTRSRWNVAVTLAVRSRKVINTHFEAN